MPSTSTPAYARKGAARTVYPSTAAESLLCGLLPPHPHDPPADPGRLRDLVARGVAFVSYALGHFAVGDYLLTLVPQSADPRAYALHHFCACVSTYIERDGAQWQLLEDPPVRVHNPVRFLQRLGALDPELLDLLDTAHYCLPMDWDEDPAMAAEELAEHWGDFLGTVRGYAALMCGRRLERPAPLDYDDFRYPWSGPPARQELLALERDEREAERTELPAPGLRRRF